MIRRCIALAVPLAFAASANAEVVDQSGTGFVSRNAVEVRAEPAEVWKSLIAPGTWWNKAHTYSGDAANLYLDAQAGGCFCETLPLGKDAPANSRAGSAEHMRVLHNAPGRVLRLSGGLGPLQSEPVGAVLTITLKPTVSGTRILWEYVVGGHMRYKVDEIAPAVDKVMAGQLASLAAHIDPKAGSAAEAAEDEGEEQSDAADTGSEATGAKSSGTKATGGKSSDTKAAGGNSAARPDAKPAPAPKSAGKAAPSTAAKSAKP